MKKIIVVAALLLMTACTTNDTDHLRDPGPPPKQVIITEKVPVPILCKAEVTSPSLDIRSVPEGAPLEQQNSALRATIAQQAQFIIDLVGAVVGCGGKVIDSSKTAEAPSN